MRTKWIVCLFLVVLMSVACGPTAEPGSTATPGAVVVPTEVVTTEPTAEAAAEPTASSEANGADLPVPDPLAVDGAIVIAGSSTVFPLSERMAERYQNEGFGGQITVDSIGSGAGFERFCTAGETDIANASRGIKDEEIANCEAIGRTPVEFRVGTDALAVVVNPANDFVTDLTLEQLALAFSTAETWADVDPAFPAEPIARYSPGTDSGTFDYFVEAVFDEGSEPLLSAANAQFSEDDNVLVQGVEGDPYAIAYFGYAYYLENSDLLSIISVDGVEPTAVTAEDGTYPLARPLFIYSAPSVLQQKPQVADFVNFFLTYVNEEIIDVGYFPASEAVLAQSRANWLAAVGQ